MNQRPSERFWQFRRALYHYLIQTNYAKIISINLLGGYKMKIGVIIETKEFEKSWNAMRFAVTAKKTGMK